MASQQKSHPLNVSGPLFTDTTCIDCGTCFHLGPTLFHENPQDEKSIVVKQPHGPKEWQLAKRAVLSCPTNSIGVKDPPEDFKLLGPGLPFEITDGVFYTGYTSRNSFGATPYFVQRERGNLLIDSPRFHPGLVKEIEKRGGIDLMLLTHQDDVADHNLFHEHFGCRRVIHEADVGESTKDCEIILTGDQDRELDPELKVILTPGHTRGHVNYLYRQMYLFTGDHLFVHQDGPEVSASRSVCWYSWDQQIKSVEKLLAVKFEWVLPGHGGWAWFGVEEAHKQIGSLVRRLKGI